MIKPGKIMSLALAFSIFAAQTVQAEVIITPLTPKGTQSQSQVSQEQPVSGPETGNRTETENIENKEIGPGFAENEAGNGQTGAAQTNGQTSGQTAGLEQPVIASEAGVLYDATHDKFLFEKNADEKLYPASITKLMTALLVLENAKLDETVTFSKTAVTNLEAGAVSLGVTEGDKISVKDCMYGLLLKSANEVANGLAEHVGGSISGFADRMNAKAAALGCTNTHFVNPNGLNDPNHYTTGRDMARIAKAAFANPVLCEIASTVSYTFPATKKSAARTLTPGHKMLYSSDSRYYPGIVGGKTGYTSLAGNTLVTCVEKDGVRLIAVVLKSRSTHYEDTKAMLDYGFSLVKAGGAGQEASGGSAAGEIGPGVPGSGGQGQTNAEGAGQTQTGQTQGPGGADETAAAASWVQDGSNWKLAFSDGTYAAGRMYLVNGVEYGFNEAGIMVTGWQKFSDEWRFFKTDGAMAKNRWCQDGDKWFYVGEDGKIARNTVIDGQYYVGEDGVWTGQNH